MSRLNLYKSSKAQDIASMNNDEVFQSQLRSEKAKDMRSRQFEQNRNIATKSLESTKSEPSKELLEWRKKRESEKRKKTSKKPFLPSGAASRNIYKPKTRTVSFQKISKSTHSSQTTNSSRNSSLNSSKSPRSSSNPNTSIPNGRVTRSQVKRREQEVAEQSLSLQTSKPVYVVEEKDLAWIPENDVNSLNLKVRRKSLHFSDVFSNAPRSPFVFRANQPAPAARPREPPIIETSLEVSPICVPGSINRNLLGAFAMFSDDTEILECEGETASESVLVVKQAEVSERETVNEIDAVSRSLVVTPAPVLVASEDELLHGIDPDVSVESGIDKYSTLLSDTSLDLVSQRDRWQATLNKLTEACDSIRVAIGHTDLLLGKKFKQYSGLIQDARDNPGNLDLETRCSDLQGFWDLIRREVEDMQSKYSRLIRLAENGYEAVKSTHKLDRRPVKRQVTKQKKDPITTTRTTRSSTASSSLREQMMRGREQLKERSHSSQESSVIIVTQQKSEK